MSNFAIAIVTPEGPAYIGVGAQALIPGSEGMFGVLAGHMNLIASVKPGLITIETADEKSIKIVVSEGIAEVGNNELSVLVEEAINLQDINLDDAKEQLEKIEQELVNVESEVVKKDLLAKAAFLSEAIAAKRNDY